MTDLYVNYIICGIQVSVLLGQIWLLKIIQKDLADDQELIRKMTRWSKESAKLVQDLKEAKFDDRRSNTACGKEGE
jgi:hypothetical protein